MTHFNIEIRSKPRSHQRRLSSFSLGDSRFYESLSVLSARKRDQLDRQRYRWDYRLRPPQSNRRVVLSFCSYFHGFVFLFTTSSHALGTSFRATARAEPLPPVPMVWFDLPLSISGRCRYWTQFVAAVAHSKAAIYLAGSLTNPIAPANRWPPFIAKSRQRTDVQSCLNNHANRPFGGNPWSRKPKRDTSQLEDVSAKQRKQHAHKAPVRRAASKVRG
jgi:hypothetical protein